MNTDFYIPWLDGEVVTLRSAKPRCEGSIPSRASRQKHLYGAFRLMENPESITGKYLDAIYIFLPSYQKIASPVIISCLLMITG